MLHALQRLSFILSLLLFTPAASASDSIGQVTQAVAMRRGEAIQLELDRGTKADWAGSYYFGDGTGANFHLSLAPFSGFVLSHTGCLGLYGLNYGRIIDEGGRLTLVCESTTELTWPLVRSVEFYPVRWDKRRYLIGADGMQNFINDIRAKDEPRAMSFGLHFLSRDQRASRVKEPLVLPPAWSGLLLDEPLEGKIVSVRALEDTRLQDAYRGPVELTLNIGSDDGALKHMRFFVSKSRTWLVGRVTSVEPDRCVVEITMCRNADRLPRKSWVLSTRDKKPKLRSPFS